MAKVEQFPDPSGEKTIEQDIKAQKTKEITKEVRDQIKEAVPEQATDTRVGPGGDRLAGEDAGTGRPRAHGRERRRRRKGAAKKNAS